MRLHPAVTSEEAMNWLLAQAADSDIKIAEADLEKALKPVAEAMAAVSAVVLPEEMEPLFPQTIPTEEI